MLLLFFVTLSFVSWFLNIIVYSLYIFVFIVTFPPFRKYEELL